MISLALVRVLPFEFQPFQHPYLLKSSLISVFEKNL